MKWFCYQWWLVSTPLQPYAHQANHRIVLLHVEHGPCEYDPGVGIGTFPPPRVNVAMLGNHQWWLVADTESPGPGEMEVALPADLQFLC
jgi:hypothetical protein